MGASKETLFKNTDVDLANLAKAIAHPARIAILRILVKRNSCVCGDLVDELPLAQSTISQHLKALKNAGLIKGEVDGPSVCYCIDVQNWNEMTSKLFKFIQKDINCC
jgi:DNA-binding transcriptional ArsR family regulator